MNDADAISTWDVLKEFGFEPDSSVMSDVMPGLSYDFVNFKLFACCCMNKQFVDVVMFTGVLSSRRSISEVGFEMLRHVESREQCAAWIVWHLDTSADEGVFTPARAVPWVEEGRRHKHLLPWERRRVEAEREREEYRQRPHCTVPREWLKLALKTLANHLKEADDAEPVLIKFDGMVLSFIVAGNLVVLRAQGEPWASHFSLPAEKLRELPKRLMSAYVDVSVWCSRLQIDRYRYAGLIEKA